MPFVRVRGKTVGDPLHEFDVTVAEVAAHPELYDVLDAEPVPVSRPAVFVEGVVKLAKKPAKRPGEKLTPRTGHDSEE